MSEAAMRVMEMPAVDLSGETRTGDYERARTIGQAHGAIADIQRDVGGGHHDGACVVNLLAECQVAAQALTEGFDDQVGALENGVAVGDQQDDVGIGARDRRCRCC